MSNYNPDKWLVIKINGEQPHYRIFGSWYGGYLGSDSWRMNSGITKVSEDGDYYLFDGSSGSIYKCHKKAHGISGYGSDVLNGYIKKQPELNIEIIPEDTDLFKLEYT